MKESSILDKKVISKTDGLKVLVSVIIIIIAGFSSIIFFENKPLPTDSYSLPIISIETSQPIEKYNYIFSNITFIDSETKQSISTISKIKIRGKAVSYFPKKGYRLELIEKVSLFGMRSDEDWELFACYDDCTKMRVKMCFDLWRSIQSVSKTLLPNSKHVIVYLNGKLEGLYLLVENFDRKLLGLTRWENTLNPGYIIQAQAMCSFFEPFGIWEQEWPEPYDLELVSEVIPQLYNFLNSSDELFFNNTVGVYNLFNKSNLLDFFIYNNLIQHKDFWIRNFFLVKNTNDDQIFLIPWDFGHSLGQFGFYFFKANESIAGATNKLFARLMDESEFLISCRERWLDLRNNLWTNQYFENLFKMTFQSINVYLNQDFEMWNPVKFLSNPSPSLLKLTLEDYLNSLYNFIFERLSFLDNLWS